MGVPQTSGDGPDVHSGAGQHGGGEVTEIVEPHRSETEAFRCPPPMARHLVRSHWTRGVEYRRPHVRIRGDRYLCQLRSIVNKVAVSFEDDDGRRIEGDAPGPVGLGVFFNESVRASFGDSPVVGQGSTDEVQIRPSETAELSSPAARCCRHEHETGELGIALLEVHQDSADVVKARRPYFSRPERRGSGSNGGGVVNPPLTHCLVERRRETGVVVADRVVG
jgi:hypothetical protein